MELSEEASKILNHPMMVEFFEKSKGAYHKVIEGSCYEDQVKREDAYMMLRALNELKASLEYYAKKGEVKEVKVKRLKSLD